MCLLILAVAISGIGCSVQMPEQAMRIVIDQDDDIKPLLALDDSIVYYIYDEADIVVYRQYYVSGKVKQLGRIENCSVFMKDRAINDGVIYFHCYENNHLDMEEFEKTGEYPCKFINYIYAINTNRNSIEQILRVEDDSVFHQSDWLEDNMLVMAIPGDGESSDDEKISYSSIAILDIKKKEIVKRTELFEWNTSEMKGPAVYDIAASNGLIYALMVDSYGSRNPTAWIDVYDADLQIVQRIELDYNDVVVNGNKILSNGSRKFEVFDERIAITNVSAQTYVGEIKDGKVNNMYAAENTLLKEWDKKLGYPIAYSISNNTGKIVLFDSITNPVEYIELDLANDVILNGVYMSENYYFINLMSKSEVEMKYEYWVVPKEKAKEFNS